MSLLKIKMPGWNEPKLVKYTGKHIYEFNADNFNIETLTDGSAQWSIYSQAAVPTLTKIVDGLSIHFATTSTACQLNLALDQFNLTKPFGVEFSATPDARDFIYLGPNYASLTIGRNNWFNNIGLWIYSPSDYTLYKGSYNYTYYDYIRFAGISFTLPVHFKEVVDPSTGHIEMYIDGEICFAGNIPTSAISNGVITFNNGGAEAIGANVNLHSLQIYYV